MSFRSFHSDLGHTQRKITKGTKNVSVKEKRTKGGGGGVVVVSQKTSEEI